MKLSLTTRIFLGYAVVLVTFGGVSGFSVLTLRQNQLEIRLVSEGYLGLSQTVAAIETFQANQAKDTERLRDETSVETRKALIRLARLYFPGLMAGRLQAGKETATRVLEFAPEAERPFVTDVARKFDELKLRFGEYETAADQAFLLLESPTPDWTRANAALDRLQQMENALSSTIRLLHGSLEARIHERVRLTQERERRTGVAIILLPVVAIGVGLLATGLTARSLRPVRTLIEGVSRIRRGDYEAKIGVEGEDEIAVLAREFDAMARALKEREAQLKQKQQELIRAERLAAVGRVSAQVAHEIRNPLSSIGLNVEMLTDQLGSTRFETPEDAKEARDLLASVMREVDRLTEITEDYLRLARLPTPAKRPEDLKKILEEVLSFAREELERAGVQVAAELPDGALPVSADEGQLRQVFLNLFRNAREAMAKGGRLTVRAAAIGALLEVRVSDTGSGMSPEVREKLFEPFFTTKPGGTGLGLSLSRQIVEAHGGRIDVDSTPGQGTTFLLEFPQRLSFSVFKDVLPSGLTVVTIETPHLHSVMTAVYVRVGSRHEDARTNGVSHMLEHLFFRGSRRYPDSVRMNAAVESVGGNLNGVTMRDSSYFYTPAHVDGLEVTLSVLGEMMTRPRLGHLETEKRIILEEMLDEVDERGRDVDVDNLSKRLLYEGHPLSMKIAGTTDSVKALRLRDVRAHFARTYVGGNLVVAVAGPVSRRRVLRATRASFRHLPHGPRLEETAPPVLAPSGPRFKYVTLDEAQVEFRLSFPTVREDHPDTAGLGLLRRVLDDGLSSRLPHNIVEKRGLAYSVGALIETFHDVGTFEIDGASAPENLAAVFEEVLRTLGTLRAGKITREELRRAKTRFAMHLDFLQDSPGELCGWFGGGELYRPAESFQEKKAEAERVTLNELQRLAKTWLSPARLVAVAVGPRSAKKKAERVITRASRWLK